ncbi:hypothetical protein WNZ14_23110 [Hoeflea sp. AS60]|uniref:hypothetical protein n=1 Tax=Hoeflea sp. AS60 TaxID=3135780 RepID=UPI0031728F4A
MSKLSALPLIVAFSFGILVKTAIDITGVNFFVNARADVAGMDYRDLYNDRDFEWAVQMVIENCNVDGENIVC